MSLRDPLNIEIAGEGKPYIKNTDANSWSGISLAWMAHGYEVKQTPLQILTYYNAIANDGVMVKPRFVEKITKGRKVIKEVETEIINPRVCSKETINKVRKAHVDDKAGEVNICKVCPFKETYKWKKIS